MPCPHEQLVPRNLSELLPIYECKECGGKFVCSCEAKWFELHDTSRFKQRMKEAEIAEKVCVACRGLPDSVAAYGRSLFPRRHWREIFRTKMELLEANSSELDALRRNWEEAESELRELLYADFVLDRWSKFLCNPGSGGTPIEKIHDPNLRRSIEVTSWRMVRNGLIRDLENGRTLLSGPALGLLEQLHANYISFYERVGALDKEAENSVREAHAVPLIGQGWVSETELFRLVQDVVAPSASLQHARLPWLGRQHLDIYVPDLGLAIEYMGEQHYHPIEFFGGKEALKKRKELDKRKAR